MRKILLFLFLPLASLLHAQQFSRVKINLDSQNTLTELAQLGLEVDHGHLQPGKYLIGEFNQQEISQVVAAGFRTEVLVADLEAQRQLLNAASQSTEDRMLPPCPTILPTLYETPANYVPGTMGGYFKYQEMLDMVDKMAELYPNLIKAKQPITTAYSTHEGRPIFWLKISDNPNVDESEPEVMYNGVHHAREPNSMSQLLFYMWYLLENYDSDPEVKYLVDNTEMYFVPCINPDGYLYNETTNPTGGGMWRKNRRDNGDGTFGVDLNRNYGYQWGNDDAGSSPNTSAQTYRGTAPFSEPETQMIRDFCQDHHFQMALNYHTFGNLLIYPWGWVDGPTQDHATFSTFGPYMARENNFLNGFGSQTVGYTTNGGSDDWMYGDMVSKEKIFSMTPEVGPSFWPSAAEIDDLNKTCMALNLTTAHLVLNFGVLQQGGDRHISQHQGNVLFSLQKLGLAAGLLTVSLEPLTTNIISVGNPINYGMFHLEAASSAIPFTLKPNVQDGELVQFNLVLDNGLYQWRQLVERIYTTKVEVAFLDEANNLDGWSTDDWAITNEQFYSTPTSLTDSPIAGYQANSFNELTLAEPINVKHATQAFLSFWAKWDIEEDEDYMQILGNFNGTGFQALCGKYTETGTDEQSFNQPLYDGRQEYWVREEIDLTEWLTLADSVDFQFAFRMVSDEFIEADGFYFDNFELTIVNDDFTSSTINLDAYDFTMTTRPNPAHNHVIIEIQDNAIQVDFLQLEVFNGLGQMVAQQPVQGKIFKLETENWESGLYQIRLSKDGKWLSTGRIAVVK